MHGTVTMDVDSTQQRMASFLRDHEDKVLARWVEVVLANGSSRASTDEVRRELGEIFTVVVRAMSGSDESAIGELRASLAELSRSRARAGATPTETASSIFALKNRLNHCLLGNVSTGRQISSVISL